MIFEHIGIIEIEEGLTLENPKMELQSVYYNLITNAFELEVHFWETKYRHSRMFTASNDVTGSLSMEQIVTFVGTHPILSQFNVIG